jgi:hypothetical protein
MPSSKPITPSCWPRCFEADHALVLAALQRERASRHVAHEHLDEVLDADLGDLPGDAAEASGVLGALDALHEALQVRALVLGRLEGDAESGDGAVSLNVAHHQAVDFHRLPTGRMGERETHRLSDGDSLARHRDQHAAAAEIASVARDLTVLSIDLRGDMGLGSRCMALLRVHRLLDGAAAQGTERPEPIAHRVP